MEKGDKVTPTVGPFSGKIGVVKVVTSTAPPFSSPGPHFVKKTVHVKFKGERELQTFALHELLVQKPLKGLDK